MKDTEALAQLIIEGFATLQFLDPCVVGEPQIAYESIKESLLEDWEDIKDKPDPNE